MKPEFSMSLYLVTFCQFYVNFIVIVETSDSIFWSDYVIEKPEKICYFYDSHPIISESLLLSFMFFLQEALSVS